MYSSRQFGRKLAKALARDDILLVDQLVCNNVGSPFYPWAKSFLASTQHEIEDRYAICARCLAIDLRRDFYAVQNDFGKRFWCYECWQAFAVLCQHCDQYWHYQYVLSDDSGTSVCEPCSRYYITCPRCNAITHAEESVEVDGANYCAFCAEEVIEQDHASILLDYHQSARNWQVLHATPGYPFKDSPPLGVELEVFCLDRDGLVADLRDAFGKMIILERDGSLSFDHGLEIITHPMGLSEHKDFANKLCAILKNHHATGWPRDGGAYGMHISVGREYLSSLQEARLMLFLAAPENVHFVRAMAQRKSIYYPSLDIGGLDCQHRLAYLNRYGWHSDHCGRKKISGIGKYSPLNLKESLAEVRVFQSTVKPERYLKNIEFVYALLDWTNPVSATGSKWHYRDFLTWMLAQNKEGQYPNLLAYIKRGNFSVNGIGTVWANWIGG